MTLLESRRLKCTTSREGASKQSRGNAQVFKEFVVALLASTGAKIKFNFGFLSILLSFCKRFKDIFRTITDLKFFRTNKRINLIISLSS